MTGCECSRRYCAVRSPLIFARATALTSRSIFELPDAISHTGRQRGRRYLQAPIVISPSHRASRGRVALGLGREWVGNATTLCPGATAGGDVLCRPRRGEVSQPISAVKQSGFPATAEGCTEAAYAAGMAITAQERF